jgi:hypothetical protein
MFQDYSQKIVRKEKPMDPMLCYLFLSTIHFPLKGGLAAFCALPRSTATYGRHWRSFPDCDSPKEQKDFKPRFWKKYYITTFKDCCADKNIEKINILHLRDKSDNV